jgi:hypothetical protein
MRLREGAFLILASLSLVACQSAPTSDPTGASALAVTEMTASWAGPIPANAKVIVDRNPGIADRFVAVIVGGDGHALVRLEGALEDLPRLNALSISATGRAVIDGPHCEPATGMGPVGDPCPPGPTGTNKM